MKSKENIPLEEKVELLKRTVAVLEKHNIQYWIIMGTLLGYTKGKTFLPGDTDIDFGVYDLQEVINLSDEFEKKGIVMDNEYNDSFYIDKKFKVSFAEFKRRSDGRLEYKLIMRADLVCRIIDFILHSLKRNTYKPGIFGREKMKIFFSVSYFVPFRNKLIFILDKLSDRLARKTIFIFKPFGLFEDEFAGVKVKIPHDYPIHLRYIYTDKWNTWNPNFTNKDYNTFSKKVNGIYITEVGE